MKKNKKKVKLDLEILELESKIAPRSFESVLCPCDAGGTSNPLFPDSGAEC